MHKLNIPVCPILGVNIAAINMEWLVKYISENISALSGDYITVANVHTTVMAYEDSDYIEIQNGAVMAIPDCGPLSSVGRRCGYQEMERTTDSDMMGEVFNLSVEHGYRHFFYGATEGTLEALKENLTQNYPGIQFVGMYSQPFHPVTDSENEEVVTYINEAAPDFLLILQEKN